MGHSLFISYEILKKEAFQKNEYAKKTNRKLNYLR